MYQTMRYLDSNIKNWVVLIVDDIQDNLEIAYTALNYFGAKVYTANNGEDGLAKIEACHPNVILLDLSMPRMTGWQMFDKVRQDPTTAHIPIIAVTAHAMAGDREQVLAAGFDGYIAKPFDISRIISYIRSVTCAEPQNAQGVAVSSV